MPSEKHSEIATKIERITGFLKHHRHAGLLIRRNENLAWITAGALTRRVRLPSDTNVLTILITQDGKRFYLTTNNEAARLADEDFPALDFEPVVWPWSESDGLQHAIANITGTGHLAADHPAANATEVDLTPFRTPLLPPEIARYRSLGRAVAATTSSVLHSLSPAITEHAMAARVSAALLEQAIEPSVLLMAVDDRIVKYKHAVPYGERLQTFGMLNLCARQAGLCISITRFVHFGKLPQQLADGFAAAAEVNAALLAASHAGVTSADLFAVARDAYARAGKAGAEQFHHQGGPAGYLERDWVINPTGTQALVNAQALAWNPSVNGGKVEDTTLLLDGRTELLTETPDLPQVHTSIGNVAVTSAGVLER